MLAKITSKNQVTLPKEIIVSLGIEKGDYLAVKKLDNKIVLIPQEFEDKYPRELLERVEKKLEKGLLPGEKAHSNIEDMLTDLKR